MATTINSTLAGMKRKALISAMAVSLGIATLPDYAAASPQPGSVLRFEFTANSDGGLFALLDSGGNSLQNVSKPYYYDSTWGYGRRTPISGTLTFDTFTGAGSATIQPFEFFTGGQLSMHDISLQAIGNGYGGPGTLVAGRMLFDWNTTSNMNAGIVWDAAGLLNAIQFGLSFGDTVGPGCAACVLPATDGLNKGKFPIGPSPMATTTLDTDYHNGGAFVVGDDGIGGDPLDNGVFPGFSINLDFTSLTLVPVPIPAAAWLFGSGLLGLVGVARRKRRG